LSSPEQMPSKVNVAWAGQRPASLAQNPMLAAALVYLMISDGNNSSLILPFSTEMK
jgi:hypothetical protein